MARSYTVEFTTEAGVYMSPVRSLVMYTEEETTEAFSGLKGLGSVGGVAAVGLGSTDLFWKDPRNKDLTKWYEMLGNISLQTDVLYVENLRSGYMHTHTRTHAHALYKLRNKVILNIFCPRIGSTVFKLFVL